ncbi:MAG: porin family protein [Geobacter sp.]|nr:MAG: porin family protein [Geobacter sp.]
MCAYLLVILSVSATSAVAESIAGRVGVTGRIGFFLASSSDFDDRKLETDAGLVGGGGLIYGIDSNLAAELDITRTEFSANRVSGQNEGDFGITNISLGAQYRFMEPQPKLVPYAGAGIDILLTEHTRPNGTKANVDNTFGVHLSGGVDYFFRKELAVTAELKALLALEADINSSTGSGHFDPSSLSGTVGIRYFFN